MARPRFVLVGRGTSGFRGDIIRLTVPFEE